MIPLLLAAAWAEEPTLTVCPAAQTKGATWDTEPLVAGADGWIFRADTDLGADFPVSPAALAGLRRYVDALRAEGTTLVLVLQPPRGLGAPARVPAATGFDAAKVAAAYRAELATLRTTGAIVPDLADAAAKAGEGYFFRRDHHWTPDGARASAVAIAAALGSVDLPDAAFKAELDAKPKLLNSSLARSLTERCGLPPIPPESYPRWTSVPVGAVDLLGDPPPAPVVVAGASNVNKGDADFFYFSGALREALGADVLNVGVDGGGYNTGLLAWVDSPEGRAAPPPKVLVWELSARLPLDLPHHFRQAIPALAGVCEKPLAEATVPLALGETTLLTVPPGVRAAGTYAVVELTDPGLVEFTAIFLDRAGAKDPLHVKRGTRLANNGRFFLEPQQSDAELGTIQLNVRAAATGTATTRLCRY